MSAEGEYRRRLESANSEAAALDRRSARLANSRGIVFFAVLTGAVVILWKELPGPLWLGVLALFAVYVALAIAHDRVLQAEARARLRATLNERGLMRRRIASINDIPISSAERKFHWNPLGPRPADHPGLSELGL